MPPHPPSDSLCTPGLDTVPGRIAHRKKLPLPVRPRAMQQFQSWRQKGSDGDSAGTPDKSRKDEQDVDDLVKQLGSWRLREEIRMSNTEEEEEKTRPPCEGDGALKERKVLTPPRLILEGEDTAKSISTTEETKVLPVKTDTAFSPEIIVVDKLKRVSESKFKEMEKPTGERTKLQAHEKTPIQEATPLMASPASPPPTRTPFQARAKVIPPSPAIPVPASPSSPPPKTFQPRAKVMPPSPDLPRADDATLLKPRTRLMPPTFDPAFQSLGTQNYNKRVWTEPQLCTSDPMVENFMRKSLSQQAACVQSVYVFRRPIQCLPHENEVKTFHEPERLLAHLLKASYSINMKVVKDLYYFVGDYGVMALRLRNVTVFQAQGGTHVTRMYRLCSMASEDILNRLNDDLLSRFYWKALALSTVFEEAMALIRFVVVEIGPAEYFVQLSDLSTKRRYSGFGRTVIEAKSHAVFSFVSEF